MKLELNETEQAELLEILGHAEAGIGEFECVKFTTEQANEKQAMVARWKDAIEKKPGQWFIAIHLVEDSSHPATAEVIRDHLKELLDGACIGNFQITNVEKLPK